MGSCQKCFREKNSEVEIEIKNSINKNHVINITDPYLKSVTKSKKKQNKKQKAINELNYNIIKMQLNAKSYSFDNHKKKRKIKKYENDDECEIIVNNKLIKNIKLNIDLDEGNDDNKVKLTTSLKETVSNNIITNDDNFEEEEESEEFLRQKQADDLFDTDNENENNGQVKNIIIQNSNLEKNYPYRNLHQNSYYYDKDNGDAILINDYCINNYNSNFEQELNNLNNNNNLEKNNYYHFSQMDHYLNINKPIYTNSSCGFINAKITEEKEENEEDQDSQIIGDQLQNKLCFPSREQSVLKKSKLTSLSEEISEQQNKEKYNNDISYEKNENDVSYEIEEADNMLNNNDINKFSKKIENGKIDENIFLDNGKIEVIEETPRCHVNLPIKVITEQKLNEKIYGIKKYPKKKFIITENFCDYIPEI